MDNNALVTVEHLTHRFRIHVRASVCAVNDVSFSIRRGEIFGLVGESGSGKSTVAKCVMNVLKPASGRVIYDGIDTSDPRMLRRNKDRLHRERQIVFQDSNSALNPRMSVRSILSEPLNIHGMMKDRSAREEFLVEQLSFVGIEPRYLDSRPPELSGGQRQRVSIARALLMNPRLLVADEPVASLDVSIQAQIVNLFKHLQAEHGFTFLFIAHDLAMVEFLCDRVGVMVQGRLVETGRTADVYNRPAHPYTKALLDAMPVPDPRIERARTIRAYGGEGLGENGCWEQTGEDHFVWTEKNG